MNQPPPDIIEIKDTTKNDDVKYDFQKHIVK